MPRYEIDEGDSRDIIDEQQSDIFNLEAKLEATTKREEKLREALQGLFDRFDPYATPGVSENCEAYEGAKQALEQTQED